MNKLYYLLGKKIGTLETLANNNINIFKTINQCELIKENLKNFNGFILKEKKFFQELYESELIKKHGVEFKEILDEAMKEIELIEKITIIE